MTVQAEQRDPLFGTEDAVLLDLFRSTSAIAGTSLALPHYHMTAQWVCPAAWWLRSMAFISPAPWYGLPVPREIFVEEIGGGLRGLFFAIHPWFILKKIAV